MRLLGKLLLILTGQAIVIGLALAFLNEPAPDHAFFRQPGVQVLSHRGSRYLWPENTLYAFQHALKLGTDILEMDIRSTKDSILVILHDPTVNRTTSGTGPVQNFTLSELKRLDAGYHWTPDDGQTFPFRNNGLTIPTLEEVFTTFPDARMNIEIKQKDPDIVDAFRRMIEKYNKTDQVLTASFHSSVVNAFRKRCPDVATSTNATEVIAFYLLHRLYLDALYTPTASAIQIPKKMGSLQIITRSFIETAHKHNMQVHVWTVNDPEDMQRLLDLGVDGLITDYPDRLLSLLDRRTPHNPQQPHAEPPSSQP